MLTDDTVISHISPKKKYNRHLGIDCEEPFMESDKSNQIIKL